MIKNLSIAQPNQETGNFELTPEQLLKLLRGANQVQQGVDGASAEAIYSRKFRNMRTTMSNEPTATEVLNNIDAMSLLNDWYTLEVAYSQEPAMQA